MPRGRGEQLVQGERPARSGRRGWFRSLALVPAVAGALVLSTGGIAHAQPPSGRDNVEIGGSCRMRDGTTAYATVTVDDYQRNSSTTTADNSGYLVNVEVWVDGYLDRKNSWWWAQKRNGTVFGGATWKFLGIGGITGMTGWYIEPFQNQVVSVAIYPRRENLQECSINIRVGDAR